MCPRSHPHRRHRHAARRTGPTTRRASYEQSPGPARRSAGRPSRCRTRWPTPSTFVGELMPRGWADDSEWGFAIEADGRYAGTISLRSEGSGRAEIGYGSHPWVRGTGYVERALRLLLDWGFDRAGAADRRSGGRTSATGPRAGSPGGSASPSTARCGAGCRSAASCRDAWVGTLLRDDPREPRTTWLANPVHRGRRRAAAPARPTPTCPGSSRASATRDTQYWLGVHAARPRRGGRPRLPGDRPASGSRPTTRSPGPGARPTTTGCSASVGLLPAPRRSPRSATGPTPTARGRGLTDPGRGAWPSGYAFEDARAASGSRRTPRPATRPRGGSSRPSACARPACSGSAARTGAGELRRPGRLRPAGRGARVRAGVTRGRPQQHARCRRPTARRRPARARGSRSRRR